MTGIGILVLLGLVCYAGTLFYWLKGTTHQELPQLEEENPRISVVVAAKDAEDTLPDLIRSLEEQTYASDHWEVWVVDDHSQKKIESIQSDRVHIQVVLNNGVGKKAALTTGINRATGNWIVTTDADCTVPETWLRSLASTFHPEVDFVAAPIKLTGVRASWIHHFQHTENLILQTFTKAGFAKQKPLMCNGANLAFRKQVFQEVNGYSEHAHLRSGDDTFLMLQLWRKDRSRLVYAAGDKVTAYTHPVNSWPDAIRQRIRWATKVKHYQPTTHISYFSLGLFTGNVAALAALLILYVSLNPIWLSALVVKYGLDAWVLHQATRSFRAHVNPLYMALSLFVYPIYFTGMVLASLVTPAPKVATQKSTNTSV